jgi:hypothetical protein
MQIRNALTWYVVCNDRLKSRYADAGSGKPTTEKGKANMRVISAGLFLLALSAPSVSAADKYFVEFFAIQDGAASPAVSHCFASFMHARETKPGDDQGRWSVVEEFSISWLPASGVVKLLAPPEKGKNYTRKESLDRAAKLGLQPKSWGPFELRKEGYDAARKQRARLEADQVAYKAADRLGRPAAAINCIHALSDVVPGPLLETGLARGFAAGELIVRHYRPLLVSDQPENWVKSLNKSQPAR